MGAQFSWFFLSFRGRISRQEFWLGYCLAIVLVILVVPLMQTMSVSVRRPMGRAWYRDELELALALPRLLVAAAVTWPMTAIYVKRLHDLGLSGWWLLFGCLVLLATTATGIDPRNYAGVALISVIGFVPGVRGVNRFGIDPLAGNVLRS
jgi:uncharacterized membrane protein YhaH (DUF805 family)